MKAVCRKRREDLGLSLYHSMLAVTRQPGLILEITDF